MTVPISSIADRFVFSAADVTGITLNRIDKVYRGAHNRKIKIGPWSVDMEQVICSDEATAKQCSFLYHVCGDVWAYLILTDDTTRFVVFDGGVLHLKSKDVALVGTKKVDGTLKKIEQAIRGEFLYVDGRWSQVADMGAVS